MKEMIHPATPTEHHRFHYLDALRGLAALLVVPRHAPAPYGEPFVFYGSFLAVDFFFCLSGFVLAFAYEQRLTTSMTFSQFLLARLIRFYPLVALSTLIASAELLFDCYIRHHAIPFLAQKIIMGFAILPYAHNLNESLFPLNVTAWTLFAELLINFAYAWLVRRKTAGTKLLAVACAASIALLLICVYYSKRFDAGWSLATAHIGLLRSCASFIGGVLLFRLFRRTKPAVLKRKSSPFLASILTLIFAATLCMPYRRNAFILDFLTDIVLFPLIIFLGASVILPPRWTSLSIFLGGVSYPLYILHSPLLWLLGKAPALAFSATYPQLVSVAFIAYLILLVITAWLVGTFYDTPLRTKLSKYFKNRRSGI